MRNRINVLSAVLCFALSMSSSGQDVRKLLEKVQNTYASAATLRTQLAYRYYDKPQDRNFVIEKVVEYSTTKNAYLYKVDGTEQLCNDRYRVFADHRNEVIGIVERDSLNSRTDFNDLLFHPDSALKQCKKYVYQKSSDKNIEWCSFFFDSSQGFSRIDFYVNAASGYISRIVVCFTGYDDDGQNLDGSRVEIVVLKTEKNISLPAAYFSESRFFTKEKQHYRLQAAYRKYTLLN